MSKIAPFREPFTRLHFVSVLLHTWCTSDIKDTILIICCPFLITESLFQNKQPKTETQALFDCATRVHTWHRSYIHDGILFVPLLTWVMLRCHLPSGHPYQVKAFCGRDILRRYGWPSAWCKCFYSCNSTPVIYSDTRYTNLPVHPTKFRADFIYSWWCNVLPRKERMTKWVPWFCWFLLPLGCSISSWSVRHPMK